MGKPDNQRFERTISKLQYSQHQPLFKILILVRSWSFDRFPLGLLKESETSDTTERIPTVGYLLLQEQWRKQGRLKQKKSNWWKPRKHHTPPTQTNSLSVWKRSGVSKGFNTQHRERKNKTNFQKPQQKQKLCTLFLGSH